MLGNYELGFTHPWMLLLLLLLIPMWWLSFNSLAGLGGTRRILALLLRTTVFTALVMALAEASWNQRTDQLTVFYLLDQSESIPQTEREQMLKFVFDSVEQHRKSERRDKVSVIVFGQNAKVESPPFEGSLPLAKLEQVNRIKTDATSLESALRLAKATFPGDSASRIVIVTDGNENLGNGLQVARGMVQEGIGIDIVPFTLIAKGEISVDKILIPSDIRKDQAFETRIVLTNNVDPSEAGMSEPVRGKLRLNQRVGNREEVVDEIPVELKEGKNVFSFDHKIDQSAVVTLDASFIPDDEFAARDAIKKNNSAQAFTHIRGEGRVLLIEDSASSGEFEQLIERSRASGIEVDVMGLDSLFTTPAELMQYDSIVLANVPRVTDTGTDTPAGFSDDQISMLIANCEQLGCGIVMIGGDRAFGVGAWTGTDLEKAMPVDFQIKNDKINAVGALALMMHASEMADGNFWQNKVAREAIKVLGPMDYCGVVDWTDYGGAPRWLWKMPSGVDQIAERRDRMLGMVGRMQPGDMPDFNDPMKLALAGLIQTPAAMKHMIIISDGDPTAPTGALIQQYKDAKIRISTVAVGTHGAAASDLLKKIAEQTGGKYYAVSDPRALPRIYQREARRVAKPLIKLSESGMGVIELPAAGRSEILLGINGSELPPVFGYVMTTVKENPLVEQLLVASEPANNTENTTLLASWRYGVGRTVVLTTDAGHRWSTDWYADENYDKFFSQMIRYSMRPVTQSANFAISTDVRDNRVRVVLNAMNEKDEFINFLDVQARGVNPEMEGFDLSFSQTAPGRYVAEFDAGNSGNYLFSIFPGEGYERLTTGISVPWSSEYSDRESNLALLESITGLGGEKTPAGILTEPAPTLVGNTAALELNPFRPGLNRTISPQPLWPMLLVFCGLTLAADVFVRRVSVPLGDMLRWVTSRFRKSAGDEETQRAAAIERLKSRKEQIDQQIESRRSQLKFEEKDSGENASGLDMLQRELAAEREKELERPVAKPIENPEKADADEQYTSRLLEAKRRAQKKRDD